MAGKDTTGVRAWCNFSLPQTLVIEKDKNDLLVVTVDDTDYELTLDAGTYNTSHDRFSSTIISQINDQIKKTQAPVVAKLGGIHDDTPRTVLVFEHTVVGDNTKTLSPTGGTALADLVGSKDNVIVQDAELSVAVSDLKGKLSSRRTEYSDLESKTKARAKSNQAMETKIAVRLSNKFDKTSRVSVRKPS